MAEIYRDTEKSDVMRYIRKSIIFLVYSTALRLALSTIPVPATDTDPLLRLLWATAIALMIVCSIFGIYHIGVVAFYWAGEIEPRERTRSKP